jgi:hypothetical protein
MSDDQATAMAHLRPLDHCANCGKPATKRLYNGRNAPMAAYCNRCAPAALRRFKEGELMRRHPFET